MALGDLVFSRPPRTGSPVELVFGEMDAPDVPAASVALTGSFAAPALAARLRDYRTVALTGSFAPLAFLAEAHYASNTARPTVGRTVSAAQVAQPIEAGSQCAMQSAGPLHAATAAAHQVAAYRTAQSALVYNSAKPLRQLVASKHSNAMRLGARPLFARYQDALRGARLTRQSGYQVAVRTPAQAIRAPHQDTYRDRRLQASAAHQVAVPKSRGWQSGAGKGGALVKGWGGRYQVAMRPPAGIHVPPVVPPFNPCYQPSPHLLFEAPWLADSNLVFICERHGPGPDPEPGATVVIPVLRAYMTINNISLRRVDGNIPIPAYGFGMSIDTDSWTWSWSASVPAAALSLVQPGLGGDPVEVEAMVNGVAYRLCVESIGSQRAFANQRISVSGRGTAAILDAPYAPVRNHGNTAARTAQQLMSDVLTVNGVGIGWSVDFGLTDWLVPGNVWANQGSYIDAILDIAKAAGGYVQPHATAQTLRILPRYPSAPWAWGAVTPDYELPSAVVSVEGIDWLRKPTYSRVHVSGVGQGVLGQVTRAGTAGDVLAPMVTDALITHADAARQRGLSILSDSGRQARVSLKLPVLAETGLILPGKFVRYVDGAETRLGLVRGTALDWSAPKLRQTISLETHLD